MMSNQYHGVAVVQSANSDLWFTFCPACSEEQRRNCVQSDCNVPQFLIPYTMQMVRSTFAGQRPDDNAVAVSKKATNTQKAAAKSIYPKSGTIQRQILELITEKNGLTDEELERILNMKHQSVSAARNVLMNKGWVINSGKTRRNLNGNYAIVWIPNPEKGA
jgi:hypothetical protein